MKENMYQKITNQVLSNLEKAGSWKKLWEVPQPVSLNNHKYSGINHLLLSTSEYESPVWGTYNQVRTNGGTVNKGEKSKIVVFWKRLIDRTTDPLTGKTEEIVKYLLRYYNVFNTDQCSFDELGKQKIAGLTGTALSAHNQRYTPADDIITQMPDAPLIKHSSNDTACYVPSLDEIRIPRLEYFHCSEAYYATMYHEMVHSTGHQKRLNRFEPGSYFGNEKYSREELIAELGSSFLCTIAGIDHDIGNTTAYIKSWLQVLSDNPSWIVWAAGKAQKAVELIVPALTREELEEVAQENTATS